MRHLLTHRYVIAIKNFVTKHRFLSAVIGLIFLITIYWIYGKITSTTGETKYVISPVNRNTIISSVSGSGQVSVFNQVDIKSKVSGDLVWIGVKPGDEIKQGVAIASLDDTDARKSVADAKLSLNEAKLNLDKSTAQAPIDYERKLESLKKAEDALVTEYRNTFNTVSKVFLDLPTIITGTEDVLFGTEMDTRGNLWNTSVYRNLFDEKDQELINTLADIAEKDYKTARAAYDKSFIDFKNINVSSEKLVLENLLSKTQNTTEAIAQAAKSEINLLDTLVDISKKRNRKVSSVITGFQTDLKSYLGTANTQNSNLSTQSDSLQSDKENILNINRDLSVLKINNPDGVKPIDLQIEENSVKKQEVSLVDLTNKLNDYIIRAPFDGVIAKVPVKKLDSVGSGATIATLVTKQKLAEISLNEVDVSKIKVGQKATLTFDAVSDLSITGQVTEIDTVGTVTQGVVNYSVKINFDTQDDRVKSGMTVSVAIITDVKPDVLVIPNSAIKSQGNTYYVEMLDNQSNQTNNSQGVTSPTLPTRRTVEIGLSNDTQTEVISGLKEDEQVISRTITSTTKTASTPSLLSAVSGRTTGTGAIRTTTTGR